MVTCCMCRDLAGVGLDCESKDRDCVGACLASQNMDDYKDACVYICVYLFAPDDFKYFTRFRFL